MTKEKAVNAAEDYANQQTDVKPDAVEPTKGDAEFDQMYAAEEDKGEELEDIIKELHGETDKAAGVSDTIKGVEDGVEAIADGDEEEPLVDPVDEEEEDVYDELDRAALKRHIYDNGLEVKVFKKDTDDDIRAKLRDASQPVSELNMLEQFATLVGTTPDAITGFMQGGQTQPVMDQQLQQSAQQQRQAPGDIDFAKELDLKPDINGELIMTPDVLNKLLNAVQRKSAEFTMKEAPIYASQAATDATQLVQAGNDFYRDNPDLTAGLAGEDLMRRKQLFKMVATSISAKNPDKNYNWVFTETAKEARKWLKTNNRVSPTQNQRAESGRVAASNKSGNRFKSRSTRIKSSKLTGEAAEVANLFS